MAINAMDSKSWICEQSRAEHGRDRTRGLNQLSKKSRRAGRKGKAVDASQSINFSACQGLSVPHKLISVSLWQWER